MSDTPEQRLEAAVEEIIKVHIGTAYLYSTNETPASVPQDSVREAKAAILAAVASSRVEWEAQLNQEWHTWLVQHDKAPLDSTRMSIPAGELLKRFADKLAVQPPPKRLRDE